MAMERTSKPTLSHTYPHRHILLTHYKISIKAVPASKASMLATKANAICPAPEELDPYYLYGSGQRLLYPVATAQTSGATTETCWSTCSGFPSLSTPFYFSISNTGACFCSQSGEVVYDPTFTVSMGAGRLGAQTCMCVY